MARSVPAKPVIATSTIHQEVDLIAPPDRVYAALTDSAQFQKFSGAPARIDPKPGGACVLFGGLIFARNIELVPGQRVVQAWRSKSWPEGMWSITRFELKASGAGTHLVFDHSSYPEGERENLAQGWNEHYWAPMKKYFQ